MRDYHVHTAFCKHAYGEISEYIESAITNGIEEICFTDHIPLPDGYDSTHRMNIEEMELYVNEVRKMRDMYPEITILLGIEADYLEGYESFVEEFLNNYPLDLVIMSVHFVKNWPQNYWVFSNDSGDKPVEQIYSEYFEALRKGINTGLFNAVGHLDLIKKMGHPVMETNALDVDSILDTIKEQGMSIEINTSGLRKSIGETYPSLSIVQEALRKGIPLIVGSDSHIPQQVGFKFREVLQAVSRFNGFKLARYRRRKISAIEIPIYI